MVPKAALVWCGWTEASLVVRDGKVTSDLLVVEFDSGALSLWPPGPAHVSLDLTIWTQLCHSFWLEWICHMSATLLQERKKWKQLEACCKLWSYKRFCYSSMHSFLSISYKLWKNCSTGHHNWKPDGSLCATHFEGVDWIERDGTKDCLRVLPSHFFFGQKLKGFFAPMKQVHGYSLL